MCTKDIIYGMPLATQPITHNHLSKVAASEHHEAKQKHPYATILNN